MKIKYDKAIEAMNEWIRYHEGKGLTIAERQATERLFKGVFGVPFPIRKNESCMIVLQIFNMMVFREVFKELKNGD